MAQSKLRTFIAHWIAPTN